MIYHLYQLWSSFSISIENFLQIHFSHWAVSVLCKSHSEMSQISQITWDFSGTAEAHIPQYYKKSTAVNYSQWESNFPRLQPCWTTENISHHSSHTFKAVASKPCCYFLGPSPPNFYVDNENNGIPEFLIPHSLPLYYKQGLLMSC